MSKVGMVRDVVLKEFGSGPSVSLHGVVETDQGEFRYVYDLSGFDMTRDEYLELVRDDFTAFLDGQIDQDVFEKLG